MLAKRYCSKKVFTRRYQLGKAVRYWISSPEQTGSDLSAECVANGFAITMGYSMNYSCREAKPAKLGIWALSEPNRQKIYQRTLLENRAMIKKKVRLDEW
jgi:endonuclease YncB( thermonuclease family)